MRKGNFLFIFLLASFLVHAFLFSYFSLYIKKSADPSIYGWLDIINKKDLFFKKKDIVLPPEVNFTFDKLRKNHLAIPFLASFYFSKDHKIPSKDLSFKGDYLTKASRGSGSKSYYYLWDRLAIFSSQEDETIPYKAFVSGQGKVVFLYPEKLPVDSRKNISSQEYIRRSVFFTNSSFFWTKLEGVVK